MEDVCLFVSKGSDTMADKGPGSTGRSTKKRLAKAKIKPTEHGIKSSKGRAAAVQEEISKSEQKKAHKQKLTAIAIGVFAVIMALSMMLPSFTYIFGNNADESEQTEQQATSSDSTDDSSSTDDQADTLTDMERVDANYAAVVDPLEEKLADNPEDLAALLNLGKNYVAWASEASSYATDDEGTEHVSSLYDKAMEYYDRYLELNDDNAVRVSRAMCQLYSGDFEGAQKALETVTENSPDYGPAWANLGLIYEYTGSTDKAKEAYQKAIEADPNDEYGAKSYANQRLAYIAASTTSLDSEDATATETTPEDGKAALEEALGTGI